MTLTITNATYDDNLANAYSAAYNKLRIEVEVGVRRAVMTFHVVTSWHINYLISIIYDNFPLVFQVMQTYDEYGPFIGVAVTSFRYLMYLLRTTKFKSTP